MEEYPKHQLTINLLQMSASDDFKTVLNEWGRVCKRTMDTKIPCICQRMVKHAYFFHNTQTNITICVGSTCTNKFMNIEKELDNPILKSILSNAIARGEYQIIDGMIKYNADMTEEVINQIQFRLENATSRVALNALKEDVTRMIEVCKVNYLGELFASIENKLADMIAQEDKLKEEQLKQDKLRKEEEYKIKSEKLKKEEEDKIKEELLRKDKEDRIKRDQIEQYRIKQQQMRTDAEGQLKQDKEFKINKIGHKLLKHTTLLDNCCKCRSITRNEITFFG